MKYIQFDNQNKEFEEDGTMADLGDVPSTSVGYVDVRFSKLVKSVDDLLDIVYRGASK